MPLMPLTNIFTLPVMVITLLSTNVVPIKPSEGFPERQFQTNHITDMIYEFKINGVSKIFVESTTNSVIGTYLPIVTTNLVPAHYKEGIGVVPNK